MPNPTTAAEHLDAALHRVANEGADYRQALLEALENYARQCVEAFRERAENSRPVVHIVPYHWKMETEEEESQGRCLNKAHFGPCQCRHCDNYAAAIRALEP